MIRSVEWTRASRHRPSIVRFRFEHQAQSAVRASRIVRNKLVDGNTSACQFGNALREAEMEPTDGIGIGKRGCRERARTKDHLDAIATSADGRIEALPLHHVDDERDRIVFHTCAETLATPSAAPYLDGRVSRSNDLAQQQAETLVRSGDAPAAIGRRMNAVVEPRPPATTAGSKILGNEARLHQLRQMLSDRVVIEAEVRRELGNVNWRARVGDVTEDSIRASDLRALVPVPAVSSSHPSRSDLPSVCVSEFILPTARFGTIFLGSRAERARTVGVDAVSPSCVEDDGRLHLALLEQLPEQGNDNVGSVSLEALSRPLVATSASIESSHFPRLVTIGIDSHVDRHVVSKRLASFF